MDQTTEIQALRERLIESDTYVKLLERQIAQLLTRIEWYQKHVGNEEHAAGNQNGTTEVSKD